MFKRLKNLWKLSSDKDLSTLMNLTEDMTSSSGVLTQEKWNRFKEIELEGDGKAEFLGEGTTEEYEDMIKEDKGEKPWYDRIKNLI